MNVRLPSDLQRLAPFLVVAILAIAGLVLVRGVGGDGGGGGADAQQVLDRAFGGGAKPQARSGKLTMNATVSLQGSGQTGGSFGVAADGKFDQTDAKSPKMELDMKVTGGGENGDVGFLVDGARAYLRFDGRWYELPGTTVAKPSEGAEGEGLVTALGFDPRAWLRDPKVVGTEKVGGVETDHVSADVDVARMASDLTGLAARSGQADEVPREVRQGLQDAVKQARVDLYVGKQDGVLYKLAASAQLDANLGQGAPPVRGDLRFDVELRDVGKPQKIEAPRDAAPADELKGLPGFGSLGSLGGGKAAGGSGKSGTAKSGSGSTGSTGSGGGSGSGAKSSGASSSKQAEQAYLSCVQQAQDAAALDKCQALVP